jgi:hypothetical protein
MSAVSLMSGGTYKYERRKPQRSGSTSDRRSQIAVGPVSMSAVVGLRSGITSDRRRNIAGGPRSTSAVGLRSGSTPQVGGGISPEALEVRAP